MGMPERQIIPEALVIGGVPDDRAEVVSRMAGCGWRVTEHWLTKEGGHDWSRLPRGVKLIVVMRDTLDNMHYQRGTNLANTARIPWVKWDVNRDRFRERMRKVGLLFQLPKPAPSVVATEAGPMVMETPKPTEEQFPRKEERRPLDPLESLRVAAELIVEELRTNPMFRGVTIRVLGELTEVLPEARPIYLGGEVHELPPSPPSKPRDACEICKGAKGGVPGNENIVEGKTMCDYCHAEYLTAKRPVVQPIVPKYEPPIKPTIIHKRRKQTRDMRCRYPNCPAQSKGPRYRFMCATHLELPVKEQKKYVAAYKEAKRKRA